MYDEDRLVYLAHEICKSAIDDFNIVYRKYLLTGMRSAETYNMKIYLNEVVNFILSDTWSFYAPSVDGEKALIKISQDIEKEIGWTEYKKLSQFLIQHT